jgi:amino acid transporter
MTPSPWLKKPLWVMHEQEQQQHHTVERHLTLFDLWSIGVGGTIGSGIFVLTGYIAHNFAGPSTVLSFAMSGGAATCSGVAYAELAGRLPASGSTYVYAYVTMGEYAAVLAAACLTLEYAVSGAAVARSWGDKVVVWVVDQWNMPKLAKYLDPGYGVNPMAFVISVLSVALLLGGIKESKGVSNVVTYLKVLLVLFMIVGGFYFMDADNLTPFAPFGTAGVMRGATSSFFGYLGYDEVCCLAGEALHPQRDMPRAVLLIIATVAILYMLAAVALTGMQPYADITAFPAAFSSNGSEWAAQLTAAGEVITLPVVVLISLMAQPRLQHALAKDGLLPSVFGAVDATGNLRAGTMLSGVAMTLIATFVPFGMLDDLISAGILLAFSMTNACLVLLRCESPPLHPNLLSKLLLLYNGLCFLTSMMLSHAQSITIAVVFGVMTLLTAMYLWYACPKSVTFGGSIYRSPPDTDMAFFKSPLFPLLPCIGTFVNWYLISQLEASGILLLLLYLGLATIYYYAFGVNHSIGNTSGWRNDGTYEGLGPDAVMLRTISLPNYISSSDPIEDISTDGGYT